ncbi:MAG: cytochrome C, partial [Pricia sp.]|nr:cytochrome C [Pricia sp.]
YVGEIGMKGGGWGWNSKERGLESLTYNGKSTFEMLTVKAKPQGFEIAFTQPVANSQKLKASDFFLQQWWYLPTENYGGPKMDVERLEASQIIFSDDGTKVTLEIPNLKEKHVVYFKLPENLKSTKGQSLWSTEAWYTLNNIPE